MTTGAKPILQFLGNMPMKYVVRYKGIGDHETIFWLKSIQFSKNFVEGDRWVTDLDSAKQFNSRSKAEQELEIEGRRNNNPDMLDFLNKHSAILTWKEALVELIMSS